MKVKILYDKYNTKIEKATLLFGELLEEELELIQEDISEDEEQKILIGKIRLTSTDLDNIAITNEMSKDDLRTFLTLIRNLLNQM